MSPLKSSLAQAPCQWRHTIPIQLGDIMGNAAVRVWQSDSTMFCQGVAVCSWCWFLVDCLVKMFCLAVQLEHSTMALSSLFCDDNFIAYLGCFVERCLIPVFLAHSNTLLVYQAYILWTNWIFWCLLVVKRQHSEHSELFICGLWFFGLFFLWENWGSDWDKVISHIMPICVLRAQLLCFVFVFALAAFLNKLFHPIATN